MGLPPEEQTTPELLKTCGYADRAMFGKWHLGHASMMFHPLNHGFTHFYGHYNGAIDYFSRERFGELDWHRDLESVHEEGYSTDLVGEAAAEFIETQSGNAPFYMLVAFNAPHSPIQATPQDLKQIGFDPAGPRAPNTDKGIARREKSPEYGERGKGNTVRQTFSAMVTALDRNLKRILESIQLNGIEENTIVIFHSDNGGVPKHGGSNKPLRGNKFTTWEGGVRVVAMIRWPKQLEGGTHLSAITSYVDLLPTIVAAAGGEAPDDVDGMNLLPLLTGIQQPTERSLLLGEKTIVSDRWKLREGQVFDLKNDPEEKNPVEPVPSKVASKLKTELSRFALLRGPKTRSELPLPGTWPPQEWKIPNEPHGEGATNQEP